LGLDNFFNKVAGSRVIAAGQCKDTEQCLIKEGSANVMQNRRKKHSPRMNVVVFSSPCFSRDLLSSISFGGPGSLAGPMRGLVVVFARRRDFSMENETTGGKRAAGEGGLGGGGDKEEGRAPGAGGRADVKRKGAVGGGGKGRLSRALGLGHDRAGGAKRRTGKDRRLDGRPRSRLVSPAVSEREHTRVKSDERRKKRQTRREEKKDTGAGGAGPPPLQQPTWVLWGGTRWGSAGVPVIRRALGCVNGPALD